MYPSQFVYLVCSIKTGYVYSIIYVRVPITLQFMSHCIALHSIPLHDIHTQTYKCNCICIYDIMILNTKIWYNVMVFSLLLFFLFVSWYQIKVIYLAILWYMLNNVDSVCMYIYIYIHMELLWIIHTVYTIHPCMNHRPATPSWSRPRWWCRRTRRGHAGSRHPSAHPWHWMKWWLKTLLENGENGGFK